MMENVAAVRRWLAARGLTKPNELPVHEFEIVSLLEELEQPLREHTINCEILIKRMAKQLRRAEPAGPHQRMSDQALNYLQRKGIHKENPLRDETPGELS